MDDRKQILDWLQNITKCLSEDEKLELFLLELRISKGLSDNEEIDKQRCNELYKKCDERKID